MERTTLSQRFAGIRIVDDDEQEDDSDLIAMRKKYCLCENISPAFLSDSTRSTNVHDDVSKSDNELEMDSDWTIHYEKLNKKCKSLISGVCFSYIGGESSIDDDILQINSERLDHEDVEYSNLDCNGHVGKNSLHSGTNVGDLNLSNESSHGIHKTYLSEKVNGGRAYEERDTMVTIDFAERENAEMNPEKSSDSVFVSISNDSGKHTSMANDKISQCFDENMDIHKGSRVSSNNESDRNKTMKGKTGSKKKDHKVVKKFDIKPSSSFPLDELLPVVDKRPSRISNAVKETNDEEVLDQVDANDDRFTNKDKYQTENHFQESDVFHGAVFDYSSSSENEVDDRKTDISTNSINTTLSFMNTGLISDQSNVPNYGMASRINSQQYYHSRKLSSVSFDTNLSEFDSPVYTSASSNRPVHDLNMETVTYSMLNEDYVDFYSERNRTIQSTLDEIGECHSVEQSRSLLNTLIEQCSVLATTDEDRMKLNAMIDALRSRILDASMVHETLNDLTPSEVIHENIVGPGGDSCTPTETELFEGRTLLKGGVEPRHIPKTNVNKNNRSRPKDPRLSSSTTSSKHRIKLPLPQFSVDLYGEKAVKKMIHLDWDVYFSSNNRENLKVKDPRRVRDKICDTNDFEMKRLHEISSPAPDSMKYTLDTGNIRISVQESFLSLNSTDLDAGSDMLAKLRDIDSLNEFRNQSDKIKSINNSSDSKNILSKNVSEREKKSSKPYSLCETPMELTQTLNTNDHPVDMDLDGDLEDGQIITDIDSLSDESTVRNIFTAAVVGDNESSDLGIKITVPNTVTGFQKKERPSTREYRSRHTSSSKSSITSSTSCDSKSVLSSNMNSKHRSESSKRDHSSGYSISTDHFDPSKYQTNDYYTNTLTDFNRRKEHDHLNHSRSKKQSKEKPQMSSEQQKQSGRRRHQTSRDVRVPQSVIPEVAQTMKRHHSLEEVVRKRHKSGDLLTDSRNNDATLNNSRTSTGQTKVIENTDWKNLNNTVVKQNSTKQSVHDRLGWQSNKPLPIHVVPKNVHEQLGYQTAHSELGRSNTYGHLDQHSIPKVTGLGNFHEHLGQQKVHDRQGQLYVHEQSGNKTLSTKHLQTGKHQHDVPSTCDSDLTNTSTCQMADEEIAEEYHKKFKSSKRNSDSNEPVDKISVVRRRKSLEEQEKEMENDKQFLEQFKMKIIGKK